MITGGRSFVSSAPAFSNDAKRLLVCTGSTVSIFSTSTGLQTSELVGHGSLVTSVIVVPASAPGNVALCFCWTSSLDGTIRYWDFAAPELMRTIDIRLPIHSMVIPSLSSQKSNDEKLPALFAYICTEDVKKNVNTEDVKPNEPTSLSYWQIRKCNLTKSRLVGGVTLAETRKPSSITISPSGKHIGIYERRTLRIWEVPTMDSENVAYRKVRLHHTRSFTTVAIHPTERMVAAGDSTGRILLWRGVGRRFCNGDKLISGGIDKDIEDRPGVRGNDDADSCTTWHWHSSRVIFLFFSSDGAYLYSGGKEGVLVVWQLDTGKKKFLPRIGSPLLHMINSSDPSLACISCADNCIHLLRMPSMEILRSISGIKGFGSGVVNHTTGLIAIPTMNYCVQFYSLFDDREISEVQICQRNHHPGDEITVKVNLVALSSDGFTMITVETRFPQEGIDRLVSLKFWSCYFQNKDFSLSTIIYEPHREAGISSIAFRPTGHMAVSSSKGGDFKIWVRGYETILQDGTHQSTGWTCHAVGSYKKKPMTAAAFSNDGSVLAIAADEVITLWDPDNNTLMAVIGDSLEPITTLSFVGKSEYLVSASGSSNPRLTLWSLSKLSTCWSYRLHAEAIACSTNDSSFAVLTLIDGKPGDDEHKDSMSDGESNDTSSDSSQSTDSKSDVTASKCIDGYILFFNVENPMPLSTWFVSKAKGGGLSFVGSNTKLAEEAAETKTTEMLAYVNGTNEYVLFNPHDEHSNKLSISGPRDFGNHEETERFGYASIYGELPVLSLTVDQTPLPSFPLEKTWKTIFSGPSHRLPPLPKLCSDFLESLLERKSLAVE